MKATRLKYRIGKLGLVFFTVMTGSVSPSSAVETNSPTNKMIAWGEPADGVSVRIRPDKTRWATNETPTFKLDVRNQGQREYCTVRSQEPGRLEMDGVWYIWVGAFDLKSSPLSPGRAYNDIPVSLGTNWNSTQEWRDKKQTPPPPIPLKLLPGKHTIRFAPQIGDTTVKPKPQNNYVPSNPAEFEIFFVK